MRTPPRASTILMPKSVRKSKHAVAPTAAGDTCFVIMPFGGWFDKYFESIFRPGIEAAGLSPTRSDDLYRPSAIIHDIWSMTKDAKLVLADLTGRNPNVFYELGLAHAIAKPAVLVTESLDDVPFDLQSLRVITYDKNVPDWGEQLKEKLTKSLKETLKSPVKSVLPTFLDAIDESARPSLSRHEKELLELREEILGLRRQVLQQSDRDREPTIPPGQAREMIADYLRRGYPEGMILDRLRSRGVPTSWILSQIRSTSKPAEPAPAPALADPGEKSDKK